MRVRWYVIVVALVALRAHADPSEADKRAAEATELAKSGDFVGAAAKFRAAFAADPRPELICNVGIAYQKAKELPRAQLFLSQCLTRGTSLEPSFVDAVRKVLVATEDKLRNGDFTPVDIVVEPPGANVGVGGFAPDETFIGSRLLWLPYGTQRITVRAEGYVDQQRDVEATSRVQRSLRIVLDRKPIVEPPPPVPSDAGVATTPVDAPAVASLPPKVTEPPSRIPPIATTIAAGALGLLAVVAYGIASDHADKAGHLALTEVNMSPYDDEAGAATQWKNRELYFASAAAVTAAVSAVLWIRLVRYHPRLEVTATGSGASVSLTGSW